MNLVTVDLVDNCAANQWRGYSVYKDSGIEWLGEIPGHWEVNKLNSVVSIILSGVDKKTNKDEHEVLLCNYVDVYYNDFICSKIDFLKATATQNEVKRCSVEIDDVLITKDSETPGDIAVPALVVEKVSNLLCGYHLSILRPFPETVDGLYLLFAIKSLGVKAQFSMSAQGITRFGLTYNSIKNVNIPVPPLPEQKAIASFLDKQTARIDALVAKKQRLLELLKEKRTALISHAVTKGLDPAVAMKDSGIDWLGEIPRHWEVKKAKYLSTIFVPQRNKPKLNKDAGLPWITMEDITHPSVKESTHGYYVNQRDALEAGSKALPDGCVIASCIGNFGVASVNTLPVVINQQLQAYIPKDDKISPWFFRYLVTVSESYFEKVATTTTLVYVNRESFGEMPVSVPPLHEQKAIASFLDKETVKLDNLMEKIRQSIETQKEYRTALISAAVTGKINVR